MRRVQYLALDDTAEDALASLKHIGNSECKRVSLTELASTCVLSYQQVIVMSKLDYEIAQKLVIALEHAKHPILMYPKEEQMTPAVKLLLLSNIALFPVGNNSLMRLSFSACIEGLQATLEPRESKDSITLSEEDLAAVLRPSSFHTMYVGEETTAIKTVVGAYNRPNHILKKAQVHLCTFVIDPNSSLVEFSTALDLLSTHVDADAYLMFQTIEDRVMINRTKMFLLSSTEVPLSEVVQAEVDSKESYLQKLVSITDNFSNGYIDADEANALATANDIVLSDLNDIYTYLYQAKDELVALMHALRKEGVEVETKEQRVAQAVFEDVINIDYLEEVAMDHKLSTDKIMERVARLETQTD